MPHKSEPLLGERKKPTNIHILVVASVCFGAFAIAEIIGAIASNSLSLLGDGAAMSVDVITYLSNMYAERVKAQNHGQLTASTKLFLEVYIPSFSICALLGVTGYVLEDAISVIRSGDSADDVNVYFLFAFASGNFLVDIVSSYMFYWRGKEVLFANPVRQMSRDLHSAHPAFSMGDEVEPTFATVVPAEQNSNAEPSAKKKPNLNMISALTHVGSDTLRTTSVFVAAVISKAFHQSPSACDAWAAIVVSISIVFAIIPLVREIAKALRQHRLETRPETATISSPVHAAPATAV